MNIYLFFGSVVFCLMAIVVSYELVEDKYGYEQETECYDRFENEIKGVKCETFSIEGTKGEKILNIVGSISLIWIIFVGIMMCYNAYKDNK